jgi:hypothetical protein
MPPGAAKATPRAAESQQISAAQPASKEAAKPMPKIVGDKRPKLVNAKTRMDAVQPMPQFSSRPPRWTDNEVRRWVMLW